MACHVRVRSLFTVCNITFSLHRKLWDMLGLNFGTLILNKNNFKI